MTNDVISPLQSTSYTNKDFQSIYVELLDLVKELTKRWDPSISNESDPGVILLKLNAIIADKCNYNIDKNVLECFPLSVTQQGNARELYEQLGYYMHWYESAICDVSMRYKGSEDSYSFTIPVFTMLTTEENTDVVYLDEKRVRLDYEIPLNEIIYDFFDSLKSRTRGYASLDY